MKAYAMPGGMHGIVEPRPSGIGITVYWGELRDSKDRPIGEKTCGKYSHYRYPVPVKPTEQAVVDALRLRAEELLCGSW